MNLVATEIPGLVWAYRIDPASGACRKIPIDAPRSELARGEGVLWLHLALSDARKGLAMFRKVNVPVLGIVENMSYFICRHCGEREEIFGHGGGRKTAGMLGVPFLGEVPIDPKVVVGGDTGEPIVASDPTAPASLAFKELARQVVEQVQSGTAGHTHGHDHDHDHHHDHDHAHTH